MQIEKQHIVHWLELCAKTYQENQDFLTDLDRDIGDADHGLNMNRGFKKSRGKTAAICGPKYRQHSQEYGHDLAF